MAVFKESIFSIYFQYMATIYGIDVEQPVTEIMVRDAIVRCFGQAHCPYKERGDEHSEELYAKPIVEKAFIDSGGDFEHPTKESIKRAVESLMNFAGNFTDSSIIQQHAEEIHQLLEKIR